MKAKRRQHIINQFALGRSLPGAKKLSKSEEKALLEHMLQMEETRIEHNARKLVESKGN